MSTSAYYTSFYTIILPFYIKVYIPGNRANLIVSDSIKIFINPIIVFFSFLFIINETIPNNALKKYAIANDFEAPPRTFVTHPFLTSQLWITYACNIWSTSINMGELFILFA